MKPASVAAVAVYDSTQEDDSSETEGEEEECMRFLFTADYPENDQSNDTLFDHTSCSFASSHGTASSEEDDEEEEEEESEDDDNDNDDSDNDDNDNRALARRPPQSLLETQCFASWTAMVEVHSSAVRVIAQVFNALGYAIDAEPITACVAFPQGEYRLLSTASGAEDLVRALPGVDAKAVRLLDSVMRASLEICMHRGGSSEMSSAVTSADVVYAFGSHGINVTCVPSRMDLLVAVRCALQDELPRELARLVFEFAFGPERAPDCVIEM